MDIPGAASSGLDDVNRRLLVELHRDPRISMSALAREVGMSAPAVTERVQRMRDTGIIRGFRLDVDPAALGYPVMAVVRVRPTAGQLDRIAKVITSIALITECHRITGEDCFVMTIHSVTIAALEATLDQLLRYGQTVTSIVVTTPVPPRPLPVS